MKLSLIKTAVTSKVGRQILLSQKHSPAILFGAGVVGVVATTVLACRATLKLDDVLEEHEKDQKIANDLLEGNSRYNQKDHDHDTRVLRVRMVGSVCKLYAPPVAIGIVSIAALTGGHVILSRRNVALTAAHAAVLEGFNKYRKRVVDELGEDKDREFRFGVAEREIVEETKQGPKVSVVKHAKETSDYARLFSRETSNAWDARPEVNFFFLQSQERYANLRLKARGHLTLNEVYDALGLDQTPAGLVVGWVMGKEGFDEYVDFGIFRGGNEQQFHNFMTGREGAIWLDFNVGGSIYDKI